MTFTPWLAQAHEEVKKQINDLPQWKQDALRRDEDYVLSSLGDANYEIRESRRQSGDE